jgi:predicted lipid carrier protein YhbT
VCAQPESRHPAVEPSDPTARLFERISRLGRVDALAEVEGRLRFDIYEGDRVEHQAIIVHRGQISVVHDVDDPDCVVDADKALFDRMAAGHSNAMTALLRGDMMVTGDVRLLVLLERLLPGPAGAHGPRRTSRSKGAG